MDRKTTILYYATFISLVSFADLTASCRNSLVNFWDRTQMKLLYKGGWPSNLKRNWIKRFSPKTKNQSCELPFSATLPSVCHRLPRVITIFRSAEDFCRDLRYLQVRLQYKCRMLCSFLLYFWCTPSTGEGQLLSRKTTILGTQVAEHLERLHLTQPTTFSPEKDRFRGPYLSIP